MLPKAVLAVLIACYLVADVQSEVTTDGCDVTKICFQDPSGCVLSDPDCHFISWRKAPDGGYEFEMSGGTGNGSQYIAFGLGLVDRMETADIYYCDGIEVRSGVIQDYHRAPKYLEMVDGLETKSAATMNGVGQCVLKRPASVVKNINDTETHDFDITKEQFYLLVAKGDMAGLGEVRRHEWRNVTSAKIDFSAELPLEITSEGCGEVKNCFKYPDGCEISSSDCRFYSWTKVKEGLYDFEMSGGTGGGVQYIAIALGLTNQMKDADLYYCDGMAVRTGAIQDLHTPPAYYEMAGGLAQKSASTVNGVAKCAFTRPASVVKTISGGDQKDFDITKEEYHLLGAIGPMNGSHIQKHNVWRTVTNETYNFANENIQVPITSDGCGATKNCFKDPENCDISSSDCRYFSWSMGEKGLYEFEMSGGTGKGQQYIAMALGLGLQMKDADLYYCDGTTVRTGAIQDLHSEPAYYEMTGGLAQKSASTVNGVAQCAFLRPAAVSKTISGEVHHNFDITKEEYHLLGAIGPMNGSHIQKHNVWRTVTDETYNFANENIQVPITSDGCGATKNCFKDPENCDLTSSDCRYFSWSMGEIGSYEFEMSGGTGNAKQYIAMALGLVSQMKDADLYYCDGTAVRTGAIQDLHNPPAYYEMTDGLVQKSASTVNGVAQCAFVRPASVTKTISGGDQHDFDITKEEYHLLGAIGPMNGSHIQKHDTWKTVTENTFNFAGEITQTAITTAGCGSTKTCRQYPDGCQVGSSTCRFYSWAKISDGTFKFEMVGGTGNGDQYVAFALGTQSAMTDADMYYCDGLAIRSGAIRDLHVEPAYLEMTGGLTTVSATTIDGIAHCVLNRPASVTKEISGGKSKNFDLNQEEYYLLAASGDMDGEQIQQHTWATKTDEAVVSSGKRIRSLQSIFLGVVAFLAFRFS